MINNHYEFTIGDALHKGTLMRVAPVSKSGSNSKLAIFQFREFLSPGLVTKLQLKIKENAKGLVGPVLNHFQSDQGLVVNLYN